MYCVTFPTKRIPAFDHFNRVYCALVRKEGTSGDDLVYALAMMDDGSTILAGSTGGDWNGTNLGGQDFAASKLDVNGNLIWTWQVI